MTKPVSLEEACSNAALAMGALAANAAHIAHARRSMYVAYLGEGFTPEQALHLCQRLTFD